MGYRFSFEITLITVFNKENEDPMPSIVESNIMMEPSENLQRHMYLDKDDLPTAAGAQAMIMQLAGAIGTCLRMGHEKGFFKDHEMLLKAKDVMDRSMVHQFEVDNDARMPDLNDTIK